MQLSLHAEYPSPRRLVEVVSGPVTVAEIAAAIGAGLARAALAGKVDGKLVDLGYRVESDAQVQIITERDAEGVDILRHSTAHLLAQAVKELFPDAQVTIGPVIENGFYDFSTSGPSRPTISPRSRSACTVEGICRCIGA